MAKSKNKQVSSPQLKNPLAFERLSFLHQASILMSTIQYKTNSHSRQKLPEAERLSKKKGKRRRKEKEVIVDKWVGDSEGTLLPVARYLTSNMRQITARMVLRLDPNVKRMVCKRCETPLIPIITSSTRIQSKPVTTTVQTCKICTAKRRYTSQKPDYVLFNDKNDIANHSEEADEKNTTTNNDNDKHMGDTHVDDKMEICRCQP
ncbi:RNAse P Rpr2/Rpp21/SNM1 subunit domain-containing protein [Mycotypha africana]|uniref:RNAse P Rpr2/Rpp21/SNM1 subunit domain-containing protein n=1 Tax=Mycotypha africana TaxID=64632 RepID=UPI00230018D0|nr:RNAse P Rpr2/Rpp21/SNM1 subunit domain-containing protein [Mycotypha africana]KAI8991721.1 RNAse P Rpr2/Rpp21/SNM1 subunit domain-containing protein [Mycotypha africana]